MNPKINIAKVAQIILMPFPVGFEAVVTYLSGATRTFHFPTTEPALAQLKGLCATHNVKLFGLCERCGLTWATTGILDDEKPFSVCEACSAPQRPTPDALSLALGVTPSKLAGAQRLNFWRNRNTSQLHIQVEAGRSITKMPLPDAIITDAGLIQFFEGWGWDKIEGKLYFKVGPATLVRV